METKNQNKTFTITKTVTVEYYFNIEAKSLRGAKQKMRNMEEKGDLTFDDGYNWVGVEKLEVEEVKNQ